MNKEHDLEIISGHCSVNPEKIGEIYQLADIKVVNLRGESQRALYGTRMVGLKSRTELNPSGQGMGIDFPHFYSLQENFVVIKDPLPETLPPSVIYAKQIVRETGLLVATEIMSPHVQLPYYENSIPPNKLLIWNPSIMQLGWLVSEMAKYVSKNGWYLGIKNGKFIDQTLKVADNPQTETINSMQKAWQGLASYARNINSGKLILIHRGVESPDREPYRNGIVHEVARKAKKSVPGALLYFDPSHICGPNMRDKIIETTVKAMHLKEENNWLYDGILIEAGTSLTDTDQHLTINEMEALVKELAKFRNLREPDRI